MKWTIGKKLIGGFMIIAFLVVIAGTVGFVVLDKVSQSTNTVVREKAPVQNAVMNATLALEKVQTTMNRFIAVNTYNDEFEKAIINHLADFTMWTAMVQYGTGSEDFLKSSAGRRFKQNKLDIEVPKGSPAIMPLIEAIIADGRRLEKVANDLIAAHQRYSSYTVFYGDRTYDLDAFLNMTQRFHLEWVKNLKDAVNIETTFTGETDPQKGALGEWIHTYKVDDEKFMKLLSKQKKQFLKLRKLAVKINGQEQYKDKIRTLNRGMGATARMDGYFKKMHAAAARIYAEVRAERKEKLKALGTTAGTINEQIQKLILAAGKEMSDALQESGAVRKAGITFLSVITVTAAVIALILGVFISRAITTKVRYLGEAMQQVAQGNLKENVEIKTKDELGDLADTTNRMIDDLRDIVGQISSFSTSLTSSSQNLTGVSQELDNNAVRMSDLCGNAQQATGEMNTSMNSITSTSQESMSNVTTMAAAIEEMTATIAEISSQTEKGRVVTNQAVDTVKKTSNRMNELGDAAEAISNVVDIIMAISEQTNLLALNATIEAARAGDAGKGFAVVASEVKDLARQANEASEDIRKKTQAIQSSSKSTIEEIKTIADVIEDVNAIVVTIASAMEEQSVTTKEISQNVAYVTTGIEGVTSEVSSATGLTGTVVADIDNVSTASQEVESGGAQVKSNAGALEGLANQLQTIVDQFKL